MTIKSGSPTSYSQKMAPISRHQRNAVGNYKRVGETYSERRAYEKTAETELTGKSLFGKIKDFFLGAKMPNVGEFSSNAEYVGGGHSIVQGLKNLEGGKSIGRKSADEELLDILNHLK